VKAASVLEEGVTKGSRPMRAKAPSMTLLKVTVLTRMQGNGLAQRRRGAERKGANS